MKGELTSLTDELVAWSIACVCSIVANVVFREELVALAIWLNERLHG